MNHIRHSGIFSASGLNVTLVGAGGIGAITALTLAKMGVNSLTIYDGDIVSPENMPTQLHRLGTEGESKVEALAKTLALFSDDTTVFPIDGDIVLEGEPLSGQVIISAVDSITARKVIWNRVRAGYNSWYFDARMAAEEFHLYAVDTRKNWQWYDAIISGESEDGVPDLPCTAKATFFCANVAAGIIGLNIRKILTGLTPKRYTVFNMVADNYLALGEA